MWTELVQAAPWLGGVGAAAGGLWAVLQGGRKVVGWLRRVGHFLDDWFGEPARDGKPEQPGVMRRLAKVEARVATIEHQVTPNSGESLRDVADRIEAAVTNPGESS